MAWTMDVRQIVRDALGLLGVVGAADPVQGDDFELGLRTFNALLQELPLHGYAWPNLSAVETAIVWSGGTPSYVTTPDDYWSDLELNRTDSNGKKLKLYAMTRARWVATIDKTATAQYPTHFYVETTGRVYLWPVPTSNPGLVASYIAKPDDAVFNSPPDIPSAWILGFQWGLAAHLAPHYQKDPRPYLEGWSAKRADMLANGVESAPITFDLID